MGAGQMPHMSFPQTFEALRTHQSEGKVHSCMETLQLDDLTEGEVVVRSLYAGVNYKDCLSLHGRAKIISSYPRVAGIELVGEVVASSVPAFEDGQHVLVHGFQTGIAFDGGFSAYARVPSAHLQTLPQGLTAHEAAVIGVPGFTAAIALERFLELGIAPGTGSVAISGAGGAVGLLGTAILSRAGYRVAAITRRMAQQEKLLAIGAHEIVDAALLDAPQRPLEKPRFAAAIDNVGGPMLSWLLRSMADGGALASVGNAAGNSYEGSVLPFIMRRVQMFGVVANAPNNQRQRLWKKLGTDWKPDMTAVLPHVHHIPLTALMDHSALQLEGSTSGRVLVDFSL